MRKLPKLGMVEKVLLVLVVFTAAMWLRDQFPANEVELAEVRALAARNEAARQAVAETLSADPSPNRRELRQLREHVVAIERFSLRLSEDPSMRAMLSERDRLAAIPLSSMSVGDLVRWMLLSAGRYMTLIVGSFVGLCGLLLLRSRGRSKYARA
ncbi:hypothetical protein [Burkholderia ubonensis]|uniref:hypothetical protein n=1 Tax=Burkholderia ubonensis TaxID=101571 RepID=UPI000758FD52|nr:hypothetical protein [Burkholderia ubonensis]KVO15150.1 hypothetical protein WJ74_10885 [Burkholderia ubonensis]KVT01125.1 hypothetical protein WK47_24940 [Burkholderia ubonensis]KVT07442.1 hypothetical protein WK46_10960 [Burkholderia ubonensis]KVT33781.1 hypothetical protein WK50_02325 [Burkholderia ubonensis]